MNISHHIIRFFVLVLLMVRPASAWGDEEGVKIGVITALSGGMATIGTAVRNGIELARSDRPELFKDIKFIYEDNQFDANQSIAAYNSLRNLHEVGLLLGFSTVLAQAIGPLVERDHVLLINFNFEAAPAVGRHYIVRAMNHTEQYMSALAAYLEGLGVREFPIIQTESTFCRAMVSGLTKALGSNGRVQEIATLNPGETDFRTLILKLKPFEKKPIGIFLFPEQLLSFLRQAQQLNLHAVYFGTDLCESAASLSPVKGLLDGCLYPDNDASEDFRSRYRETYGNEAQLTFAGSAYDMTVLIGELLRSQTIVGPDALLQALSTVKDHTGVLGKFSFRNVPGVGSFFEYPIYVKRIAGNRGVAVR